MESVYTKKLYSEEPPPLKRTSSGRWVKVKDRLRKTLSLKTRPGDSRRFPPQDGVGRRLLAKLARFFSDFWAMKPVVVSVGTVMILMPLALLVDGPEAKCAYVLMIMAFMWLTEAVPVAVTALLPVFMFPFAGILTAKDVGHSYLSNTSLLFIGGLIVAVAVEEANLHRRIALTVLKCVGSDPKWIMLGLMLPTWFLSMWISNTATASMMVPIVEAVLQQVKQAKEGMLDDDDEEDGVVIIGDEESSEIYTNSRGMPKEKIGSFVLETRDREPKSPIKQNIEEDEDIPPPKYESPEPEERSSETRALFRLESVQPETSPKDDQEYLKLTKGLSLCIAYACNVGGIATLTGTPPNLVLKGQADMFFLRYSDQDSGAYNLTFVGWMVMAFPLSLIMLVLAWSWLVLLYLRSTICHKNKKQMAAVKKVINAEYRKIGSITFAEVMTLILFIILILLWVSRDPKVVPGWSVLFKKGYVSDATAAMLVAVMFFILPSEKPRIWCWSKPTQGRTSNKYVPLLTWNAVQSKLPWGVIILLGGGFALAKACKFSGLSVWVGNRLATFDSLPPWAFNYIICLLVVMVSEVTSNTATATLLMPIMAELSLKLRVNPLYMMSSAALATSFAFMMPVATPPNAIVYSRGYLKISDMAQTGFMVNIMAVTTMILAVNTWGNAFFNFGEMPEIFINGTTLEVGS